MAPVLVIDFGLVVLIWMVQLVIYPSFCYYDDARLKRWHQKYTRQVTYIVLPLMVGQVIWHANMLWGQFDVAGITQFAMILVVWGLTFFKAVPLHNKIDRDDQPLATAILLVRWNWPRTVLWSLVFILHFF